MVQPIGGVSTLVPDRPQVVEQQRTSPRHEQAQELPTRETRATGLQAARGPQQSSRLAAADNGRSEQSARQDASNTEPRGRGRVVNEFA